MDAQVPCVDDGAPRGVDYEAVGAGDAVVYVDREDLEGTYLELVPRPKCVVDVLSEAIYARLI